MPFRKRNTTDLQAYVEQMIAHQDRLRAFVYSLMPNSPHIADVVQNTNAVLWQKRANFDADTNFTAWAFKIARYQTMHQLDRDKRDGRLVFSDDLLDAIAEPSEENPEQNHVLKALESCMAKLGKHQRELIENRYTPGKSLEQLAQATGRSAGSLRIALHRIRDQLRACIESRLSQDPI